MRVNLPVSESAVTLLNQLFPKFLAALKQRFVVPEVRVTHIDILHSCV